MSEKDVEQKIAYLTELLNNPNRKDEDVLRVFHDLFQLSHKGRDIRLSTLRWLNEAASPFLSAQLLDILTRLHLEDYFFHFVALNLIKIEDVVHDLSNDNSLKEIVPHALNKLRREILLLPHQNLLNSMMETASEPGGERNECPSAYSLLARSFSFGRKSIVLGYLGHLVNDEHFTIASSEEKDILKLAADYSLHPKVTEIMDKLNLGEYSYLLASVYISTLDTLKRKVFSNDRRLKSALPKHAFDSLEKELKNNCHLYTAIEDESMSTGPRFTFTFGPNSKAPFASMVSSPACFSFSGAGTFTSDSMNGDAEGDHRGEAMKNDATTEQKQKTVETQLPTLSTGFWNSTKSSFTPTKSGKGEGSSSRVPPVQILRRPQTTAPSLQESINYPNVAMIKTNETVDICNWGEIADQADASTVASFNSARFGTNVEPENSENTPFKQLDSAVSGLSSASLGAFLGEPIIDSEKSTKGDDGEGEEPKEQESSIPRIIQILRRPQATVPRLHESINHPDVAMIKSDETAGLCNWGDIADQEEAANSVISSGLAPGSFDNLKRELTESTNTSSLSRCGIDEPIFGSTIGLGEGEKVEEPGSISPRTVQITPVQAVVDGETGDGDEEIIFSQPACLRRYDALTKEWKKVNAEGDIKIIYQAEKNTFRIVMHGDQGLKLVCDHCITPEMVLKPVSQSTKSWTWFVLNSSGNELVPEDFWVHFSQQDAADLFVQKFLDCRSALQGVISTATLTEKEANVEEEEKEEVHDEPDSRAVLSPVSTD